MLRRWCERLLYVCSKRLVLNTCKKFLAKTKIHRILSSPHLNQLNLKGDQHATTTKPLSFIGSGFLLPALVRILSRVFHRAVDTAYTSASISF